MGQRSQYEQILAAVDEGHPALVIELAKRYLDQFPETPWILLQYGSALQDVARYDEARAAYDRALAVMPTDEHARVFRQLGSWAQAQGQVPEAEEWYGRAIQALPDDATGYIYLGAMLAKAGRLQEAEAIHRRATGCTEGCIDEAYLNLGFVLRAQERYLEALEAFREAAARDPLDADVQLALEDMEQVLFRFPEA